MIYIVHTTYLFPPFMLSLELLVNGVDIDACAWIIRNGVKGVAMVIAGCKCCLFVGARFSHKTNFFFPWRITFSDSNSDCLEAVRSVDDTGACWHSLLINVWPPRDKNSSMLNREVSGFATIYYQLRRVFNLYELTCRLRATVDEQRNFLRAK